MKKNTKSKIQILNNIQIQIPKHINLEKQGFEFNWDLELRISDFY
jgi:hypothetical protein